MLIFPHGNYQKPNRVELMLQAIELDRVTFKDCAECKSGEAHAHAGAFGFSHIPARKVDETASP